MISHNENGILQTYQNPLITQIQFYHSGACEIHFVNGETRTVNIGCKPAYNSQFGIPLSQSGELLFLGSWEKGLSAFETRTGKLSWHYKATRIMKIMLFDSYLVCVQYGKQLLKLNQQTGEVLGALQSGTIERAFRLSDSLILADKVRGKLSLVEADTLGIQKIYSKKEINPLGCLSQIIREATLQDGHLTIAGFEGVLNSASIREPLWPFRRDLPL